MDVDRGRHMTRTSKMMLGLVAMAVPAGALAAASDFTLVNGTGAAISAVSIKRTGTSAWRPLTSGLSAGARSKIAFSDPDCAFDIKVSVGGSEAIWGGVNLCEVSTVTLKRDASGATWTDYD